MTTSTNRLIEILDSISDVTTDTDQLYKLETAINDVEHADQPFRAVEALLRIFERFPESDGFGIFWSILHTIEAVPGYEPFLLVSVKQKPSYFTLMMINRIINGGQSSIEGHNLLSLLADIAANTNYSENIRKAARDYLEYQESKA